jgi:type III secretion protein U
MADSSSEEKTQPASDKKVADARKKGQVAYSRDLVSALVLLACVAWLYWQLPVMLRRLAGLFSLAGESSMQPFDAAVRLLFGEALGIVVDCVGPILLAVAAAVMAGATINTRGFVFSTAPLIPSYDRIDPVAGLKRLFALRSVIELVKELVKFGLLATVFVAVCRLHLESIVTAPRCGLACLPETFVLVMWPATFVAVVALLVFGLIDARLQTWLHRRDLRMTHSETRRERKENEGDPHIRRERRKLQVVSQSLVKERGMDHAMVVIGSEASWVVGLHYRRGVTPVPVVVFRAPPTLAPSALLEARARGKTYVEDAELANTIGRRVPTGGAIPPSTFERVAVHIVRAQRS